MGKLEKWLYIYCVSWAIFAVGALWLCFIIIPSVFAALELENWIIVASIMFPCALLIIPVIATVEVFLYFEIIDAKYDLSKML